MVSMPGLLVEVSESKVGIASFLSVSMPSEKK